MTLFYTKRGHISFILGQLIENQNHIPIILPNNHLRERLPATTRPVRNCHFRHFVSVQKGIKAGKDCVFENGQTMRWRSAADEKRTPAEWGVPDLCTYRHIPLPSVSETDGPGQSRKGCMNFTWNRNETKAQTETCLIKERTVGPRQMEDFETRSIFLHCSVLCIVFAVVLLIIFMIGKV